MKIPETRGRKKGYKELTELEPGQEPISYPIAKASTVRNAIWRHFRNTDRVLKTRIVPDDPERIWVYRVE